MPHAINDNGVIVGTFTTSNGLTHAFRHTGSGPVTAADDLGTFPGVGSVNRTVYATAVNSAGLVAGYAQTDNASMPNLEQDAFVFDSAFHDLGTFPSSGRSVATVSGVNASGTIVGQVNLEDQGLYYAFRHSGTGPITMADDLSASGGYTSIQPFAINKNGLVVGGTVTSGGPPVLGGSSLPAHVFAYDTSFHDLGIVPGGTGGSALAVNDSGVIVGYTLESDGSEHAFRHSGLGALTASDDLGAPTGFTTSVATAVNAAGDTVGNLNGATSAHAFVCLAGGKIRDLNDPVLVTNLASSFGFQIATGINSRGQIVGYTNTSDRKVHAWLLTPSP